MRKAFLALTACALLAASGCHYNLARNGCSDCSGGHGGGGHGGGGHASCGHAGCGHAGGGLAGGGLAGGHGGPGSIPRLPHGALQEMNNPANGGPPSAATAYPYYSVKAPRDFLTPNPPSIGY